MWVLVVCLVFTCIVCFEQQLAGHLLNLADRLWKVVDRLEAVHDKVKASEQSVSVFRKKCMLFSALVGW
jgi:hypothetical protein